MHTYPLPGIRNLSIIFFAGLLSGNTSLANNPKQDPPVKTSNQQEKEILVYIGFVGRKMIKSIRRTELVIETYKLPPEIVKQINKLQFSSNRYHYKALQKEQLLLSSLKDSCRVYIIKNLLKYKCFYPQGLKKGMVISENEFALWDFAEQMDLISPIKKLSATSDSIASAQPRPLMEKRTPEDNETVNKIPHVIEPETINPTPPLIVSGKKNYVFHPWDTDETIGYQTTNYPSFDHFIDSLFLHLSDFSEYIGAQRIKLELFDQPFTASFYANMYIHYVDSIVSVLKQKPQIKPGEYENFILYTSGTITGRFKYGANLLLWQGIRRDRLDCDNTSYLVYDIGKRMGFDVSIVFLWYHALVIIGNYAYETTRQEYFPKEQLKEKYSTVFLITDDPKKIHAFLSSYEISIDLKNNNESDKAKDFLKIRECYFPDETKSFNKSGYIQ